jgi:hypothetical protein
VRKAVGEDMVLMFDPWGMNPALVSSPIFRTRGAAGGRALSTVTHPAGVESLWQPSRDDGTTGGTLVFGVDSQLHQHN